MSERREIRFFDYVNHPYSAVRDVLTEDALSVFRAATKAAAGRAKSVAAELRVNLAGIEIGTDISISVQQIEEVVPEVASRPSTSLQLEWGATKAPHLFPLMKAELLIYPLTSTETQLDLQGRYQPPLGPLGNAMDAIAGHRIADASVHRFVSDVAEYLRTSLA